MNLTNNIRFVPQTTPTPDEKQQLGTLGSVTNVADVAARLALTGIPLGYRVIQDNLPYVMWTLIDSDPSDTSAWLGLPITTSEGELVGPIINRTGTEAELAGVILNAGELGYASDSGNVKMGDGSTVWEDLNSFTGLSSVSTGRLAAAAIAPFAHISTNSKHYRSIQFISTKNGAVDGIYVKTTTGYARITNFDATQEANAGAGTPASDIYLEGGVPGTGYDNVLPKFYVIDPTDVSGSLSGDITYLEVKSGWIMPPFPPEFRSSNITALNVAGLPVLTTLSCSGNYLALLDVAGCTSLSTLSCSTNSLTSLDLTGLTSLSSLDCTSNNLTSLDLTGLTSLSTLTCTSNNLTSLDLTGLTSLSTLTCAGNSLTSLDLTGLTSLVNLHCSSNNLTSLDLTGLTSLSSLTCFNNSLTSLGLTGLTSLSSLNCSNNSLTSLDLTGCTSLSDLYCSNNSLTSLDLTGCTSLSTLDCYSNINLTQLVIPEAHTLSYIDTHESGITNLDLSNSSGQPLMYLYLHDGALETLDISNACNPAATLLECQNNNLTSIRAVGLRAVYMAWWYYAAANLSNNQLSAEALDQFYTDLAVDETGTGIIDVSGNPGVAGHDPSIATAKGYTVLT